MSNISLHKGDLPADLNLKGSIAVDTETMGLRPGRDPLCLLQLCTAEGDAHLVQFNRPAYDAPRLKALLTDPKRLKIFHFARFDLAMIERCLGVVTAPVYCTKLASRLARTYAARHGLKDLCRDLLGFDISKQQQESDWGRETLSPKQMNYAAGDVIHLHALMEKLSDMLKRENRLHLAQACFDFLPHRAKLDLAGWSEDDVFSH